MRDCFLLALVLPFQAAAACLDTTALENGIVVTLSDTNTVLIERIDGDKLRITRRRGSPEVSEAFFGVYATRTTYRNQAGVLEEIAPAVTELPQEPASGLVYETNLPPIDDPYPDPGRSRYTVNVGQPVAVEMGRCTYKTLSIRTEWFVPTLEVWAGRTNEIQYFPELGFGLRVNDQQIKSISRVLVRP